MHVVHCSYIDSSQQDLCTITFIFDASAKLAKRMMPNGISCCSLCERIFASGINRKYLVGLFHFWSLKLFAIFNRFIEIYLFEKFLCCIQV